MRRFYVYNLSDGKIVRHGICQDVDFELQAHEGEAVAEGRIEKETHFVNGKLVTVPPPPPTAEEKAAQEEYAFHHELVGKLAKGYFNHENRLRVLEGKQPLTWDQFKTFVRNNL